MRRLVADHYGTTCVVLNAVGLKTALVSRATRDHERRADLDTPRTRAATIWRIEHRDDYANTVY